MAEATSSVSNSGRRLTYADPRDLPSFPSSGLPSDGAAAGAAATLGWHSHSKSADMTKSDQLSSASAAAVLSRDARKSSTSTPSSESAGHQAALLAVGSASSALKHQSSNSSSTRDQHEGWGTSAATQAFHAIRSTPRSSNNLSPGNTAATQAFNTNRSLSTQVSRASSSISDADRSLAAAKGAMASARPRSTSTPTAGGPAKPASTHSRAYSNALDGASIAHRSSVMSKASIEDTGAVPVTTMTRNMFTSNPKVKLEIDEQKNTDRLRLSAIEMARKMYTLQQAQGNDNGGDSGNSSQAPPYTNLQDAAYRQAQDRLAKLDNSYTRNRDMQEYYGNPKMPKRHFSVSHRLRRKNSDDYVSDRRESERIRQQMSMFSNKLTEVDETKRENDRDALLAAAQRNVKARLQDMDEKVFSETGMVSPSLSKDWGTKVHDAAKNRIVSSSDQEKDRRDLGGGMFMDQEQIDAIAAMRMQPVLDDLNEKAEKERERLATLKAEEDARKGELARQKEREREAKEFNKKIREEDKLRRHKEKEEERAKKEQEKAEVAQKKRLAREEKHGSKHDSGVNAGDVNMSQESHEGPASTNASENRSFHSGTGGFEHSTGHRVTAIDTNGDGHAKPEDTEQSSPKSKVKGWLRNRFSRGRPTGEEVDQYHHNQTTDKDKADGAAAAADDKSDRSSNKRRSLFWARGGSRGPSQSNASAASLDNGSMGDVAMSGRSSAPSVPGTSSRARRDSQGGVSIASSVRDVESEEVGGGQDQERERFYDTVDMLPPPRPLGGPGSRMSVSPSPSRDSRFHEDID